MKDRYEKENDKHVSFYVFDRYQGHFEQIHVSVMRKFM